MSSNNLLNNKVLVSNLEIEGGDIEKINSANKDSKRDLDLNQLNLNYTNSNGHSINRNEVKDKENSVKKDNKVY